MDSSPADPQAGDNIGLFLEPLPGWGTGRLSHSPAMMASPTAVSMELTGGSQDDPYGRAEDLTGLSMLSGDMLPGSTGSSPRLALLSQTRHLVLACDIRQRDL